MNPTAAATWRARTATWRARAGAWRGRASSLTQSWVVRDVLTPFATTRGVLLVVGLIALSVLRPRRGHSEPTPFDWLNMWTRWDAGWYVRIAQGGYAATGGEGPLGFFPLYPVLMRVGAVFIRDRDTGTLFFVGFVISNVALVMALLILVALVRLDFDAATAGRTALYLLVFPTTLFLSAVYSESTFLACAVGAIYCARTDRWWIAGALGAAAALARPHGVLIAVPLAYEYFAARGFHIRRVRPNVLSLALVPAALLAFMAYLGLRFGDPFAVWRAHEAWERELVPPWETLRRFFDEPLRTHSFLHSPLDLAFAIVFAVLVLASWKVLPRTYALFATLPFLAVLSSGTLASMTRQGLVLFPIFIVLALAGRHAAFDRAYLVVGSTLAALFMAMFARWYWVA